MSQAHFATPSIHRPSALAGTSWHPALVTGVSVAIAAVSGFFLALCRQWQLEPVASILVGIAGFFVGGLMVPAFALRYRRGELKGRHLTLRLGGRAGQIDLSRISGIHLWEHLVEIQWMGGSCGLLANRLSLPGEELRIRRRRVLRQSGLRALSSAGSRPVGLGRVCTSSGAVAAWAGLTLYWIYAHGWGQDLAARALPPAALVGLWLLGRSARPGHWVTARTLHTRRWGTTRRTPLGGVEWFGWRSGRRGVQIEVHAGPGLHRLRCSHQSGALLCNLLQWNAPRALQVDLAEGRAHPGPRTPEVSSALAEAIRDRLRVLSRRRMARSVAESVALAVGLVLLVSALPVQAGRYVPLIFLAVLVLGGVHLLWIWQAYRRSEQNIHQSLPDVQSTSTPQPTSAGA